jgi:hypothetical protein
MSASSFILQPVLYFGDDASFTWEYVDVDEGEPDIRVHVRLADSYSRFATIVFSAGARSSWLTAVKDLGD